MLSPARSSDGHPAKTIMLIPTIDLWGTQWAAAPVLYGALLIVVWLRLRRTLPTTTRLILLLAGLLGGRLVYLVEHLQYFLQYPNNSWQFWQGGLSSGGLLLGSLLALAMTRAAQRQPFVLPFSWTLGGAIVVFLIAYTQNHWVGQALPAGSTPALHFAPDAAGDWAWRYPTPLLSVLMLGLGWLWLAGWQKLSTSADTARSSWLAALWLAGSTLWTLGSRAQLPWGELACWAAIAGLFILYPLKREVFTRSSPT
jgi:hypothetical protein